MLSSVPGLGSVSGVVHLAARRPYIVALAVAVLATVALTHSIFPGTPAPSPPPVPTAPAVQHTRRPAGIPHEHVAQHSLGHRENSAGKQQ
jgi:hypothetical protein